MGIPVPLVIHANKLLFFILAINSFQLLAQGGASNSLYFDGKDDHAQGDFHPNLNLTGQGTIEAWIKPMWEPYLTGSTDPMVAGLRDDTEARYSIHVHTSLEFAIFFDGTSTKEFPYGFKPGRWYHIAFVIQGDSTDLYVNGTWAAREGIALGTDTNIPFQIGSNGSSEFWKGNIDEIRVWSDVRSLSEIRTHMCKRLDGNETSLVAYYPLDYGSDTILYDQSPTANTMAIWDDRSYNADGLRPPVWTPSGAPVGDISSFSDTATVYNLLLPNGEGLNIEIESPLNEWVHVYQGFSAPLASSVDSNMLAIRPQPYWGIFFTEDTGHSHTFTHSFDTSLVGFDPAYLGLAKRKDGEVEPWSLTTAIPNLRQGTFTHTDSGRKEFILAQTALLNVPKDSSYFLSFQTIRKQHCNWNLSWEIKHSFRDACAVIEYGDSPRTLDSLDRVPVVLTTDTSSAYKYENLDLDTAWNYVRIRLVDKDGGAIYSSLDSIFIPPTHIEGFALSFASGTESFLQWKSPQSLSDSLFFIEYSTDSISFIIIDTLMAQVDSLQPVNYSYTHSFPPAPTFYYRIRSVDKCRNNQHSKILSLSLDPGTPIGFSADWVDCHSELVWQLNHPNPIREMVVEYAFNNDPYDSLSQVPIFLDTFSLVNYRFTHLHPGTGKHHYRLRLKMDGSVLNYSEEKAIDIETLFVEADSLLEISYGQLELVWEISQPANDNRYVIEHSRDSILFDSLSAVLAIPSSSGSQAYTQSLAPLDTGIHYYRVKAMDQCGNATFSKVHSYHLLPSIANIQSFSAVKRDPYSIQLSWMAGGAREDAYFIINHSRDQVMWDSLLQVSVDSIWATGNTYEFHHARLDTGYHYYRIISTAPGDTAFFSNIQSAYLAPATFTQHSLELRGDPFGIEISWSMEVPDRDSLFTVYHSHANGSFNEIGQYLSLPGTIDPLSYSHFLPDPDTGLHRFYIILEDKLGNLHSSDTLEARLLTPQVHDLRLDMQDLCSIEITWKDSQPSIPTYFQVDHGQILGQWDSLYRVESGFLLSGEHVYTHLHGPLDTGRHYYRVQSFPNSFGQSQMDSVYVPAAHPQQFSLNYSQANGAFLLQWALALPNRENYFIIEHALDGIAFDSIDVVFSPTDHVGPYDYRYIYEALQPGNHTFRVVLVDKSRNQTFSPSQSFTLNDPKPHDFEVGFEDCATQISWSVALPTLPSTYVLIVEKPGGEAISLDTFHISDQAGENLFFQAVYTSEEAGNYVYSLDMSTNQEESHRMSAPLDLSFPLLPNLEADRIQGTDSVILSWELASQGGLSYVHILRTNEQAQTDSIATLPILDGPQHYQHVDEGLKTGSYFYSLVWVDTCEWTHASSQVEVYIPPDLEGIELFLWIESADAQHVELAWTMNPSLIPGNFVIQQAKGGNTFKEIVSKGSAKGELTTYVQEVGMEANVTSAYRLRFDDEYGQSVFSNTVILSSDQRFGQDRSMLVFPNPIQSQFTLSLDFIPAYTGSIDLFDLQGRNIFSQVLEKGIQEQTIVLPQKILRGTYLLRLNYRDFKLNKIVEVVGE